MIDLVVDRREMKGVIISALRFMGARCAEPAPAVVAGEAGAPVETAAAAAPAVARTLRPASPARPA
jgi:hypothetical protein